MSVNWVMLTDRDNFVELPQEYRIHSSTRVGFTIQTPNGYPGKSPFSLTCASGSLFLTNQRVIFLPGSPQPQLLSFAVPLLNIHDSRINAPLFGPNNWEALIRPTPNGGIPMHQGIVQLKMTFKSGGAYDFYQKFVQIKERLSDAVAVSASGGQVARNGTGGVNMNTVHLDDLPRYEEQDTTIRSARQDDAATSVSPPRRRNVRTPPPPQATQQPAPAEPPPGYEEAQMSSVLESLGDDSRLQERVDDSGDDGRAG